MLSVVAGTPWTPYGNSPKPSIIFTIGPNGVVSTTVNSEVGPYDEDDDTYIGVVNNSGHSLTSLKLAAPTSASGGEFEGIFGFDEDGIQTYESPVPSSGLPVGYLANGYEGPDNYFSDISADETSGTVNFIGGLAPGRQTYFSLEGAPEAIDSDIVIQITEEPSNIVPPAPTTFTGVVATDPVVPTTPAPDRTSLSLLLLKLQPATLPQKIPDGPGHGSVVAKDELGSAVQLVDDAMIGYDVNEKFLLTGFLDSVDPEMLVIDLGDEPPSRIAAATPKTPLDASPDNIAKPGPADHADTRITQNENRRVEANGSADQLKSNPVPYQVMKPAGLDADSPLLAIIDDNWKWIAGTAGVLLLGGAGWKGRSKWMKAARKLRSR